MNYKYKPKAFYRTIKVYDKLGGNLIETMSWENMKFELVMKWSWYFKYRAALLQIKYPKYLVELIQYDKEPEGRTKDQIEVDLMRKRITTCKRMITQTTNVIERYENNQQVLLIPDYENEKYLKLKIKLQGYKKELINLSQKI